MTNTGFIGRIELLKFLQRETEDLDRKLLLMVIASGVSNALILDVINSTVQVMEKNGPDWKHFVWFGGTVFLFIYSLQYVLHASTRITESAISSVRIRLADKIRCSELLALEEIGAADIHARISRDTAAIAQSVRPLFVAAQSLLMVIFTMLYLAFISPVATGLCLILIVGGIVIYLRQRKVYAEGLENASRKEDELHTSLSGILDGFKEIRINQLKSDDVFNGFKQNSNEVRDIRTRVMLIFSNNIVFIELLFLLLLGAVVFILPLVSDSEANSTSQVVAAILFFFGPLGNAVSMVPVYAQVTVMISNLNRLEKELDQTIEEDPDITEKNSLLFNDFQSVNLKGAHFSYKSLDGTPSFSIGPIDFSISRGEVLFLVGGNGSGKTTFLKLLTALYQSQEGVVLVDDQLVTPSNRQLYRNLFSAIFSDFYLFDKLHGLRTVAPDRVNKLLKLMQISEKTHYDGDSFSDTRLSTGQRKRLALIVSYLENKPICIFDEVAADQDPQFRKYFYETLVPEMKKDGKTIIIVSHDDRYFHVGDRVITMDYGNMTVSGGQKP
jgi:putative pyoverdin transport system ATP-binding/permease protein